jgi:hypothetical protein
MPYQVVHKSTTTGSPAGSDAKNIVFSPVVRFVTSKSGQDFPIAAFAILTFTLARFVNPAGHTSVLVPN